MPFIIYFYSALDIKWPLGNTNQYNYNTNHHHLHQLQFENQVGYFMTTIKANIFLDGVVIIVTEQQVLLNTISIFEVSQSPWPLFLFANLRDDRIERTVPILFFLSLNFTFFLSYLIQGLKKVPSSCCHGKVGPWG